MSFDWLEYFYQAQDVSDKRHTIPSQKMSPANEADMRTAISRAYYAAFHKAKEFLQATKDLTPETPAGGVHERLISRFTNNSLVDWRVMGAKLDRMKKLRHTADYNYTIKNKYNGALYNLVEEVLLTSQGLINEFNSILDPDSEPLI